MKTERLWTRDSQYYCDSIRAGIVQKSHIRETVNIDLTQEIMAPTVSRHNNKVIDIHDITRWGVITLTIEHARALADNILIALAEQGA